MSSTAVLVLTRLAKSYRAGVLGCAATVEALRAVTLHVEPGELVTVGGDRGAGKTTLLLCAAGMLRADAGDVSWPSLTARPGRPPAGIAYAAERTPMYGFLTVRESLGYAATVRELHDPGTAGDADAAMDLSGLREHADVRLGLLGAAERDRLIVALALIAPPRLLLVDDVTGGSDAVGRAAFAKCLARVTAAGTAVVWAARAIGVVAEARAAYVLAGGRLHHSSLPVRRGLPRTTLELDVPAPHRAATLLAERLDTLHRRDGRVRVSLDTTTPEEVLAVCRDLAIPVLGSRVVREP